MLKRAAERAAINAPLQGAQSDIIKLAMIKIHNWLASEAPDASMIMQVHDELVFEIPDAKVSEYSLHISNIMSNVAQLSLNLSVGVGVGNNWDEAH
jgi:DNA polymerase-1